MLRGQERSWDEEWKEGWEVGGECKGRGGGGEWMDGRLGSRDWEVGVCAKGEGEEWMDRGDRGNWEGRGVEGLEFGEYKG